MISHEERATMLAVALCGPRVVELLESIRVRRLSDLRDRDPWDLMHEINLAAGRTIWHPPMAIAALQNPVDAAEREDERSPAPPAS